VPPAIRLNGEMAQRFQRGLKHRIGRRIDQVHVLDIRREPHLLARVSLDAKLEA
jgi:hypothetical protein